MSSAQAHKSEVSAVTRVPSHKALQAVSRVSRVVKLTGGATSLLLLFVDQLHIKDGIKNLAEWRWDSITAWCEHMGFEVNFANKKIVQRCFQELRDKGLMGYMHDRHNTTKHYRWITAKGIALIVEHLEVKKRLCSVPLPVTEPAQPDNLDTALDDEYPPPDFYPESDFDEPTFDELTEVSYPIHHETVVTTPQDPVVELFKGTVLEELKLNPKSSPIFDGGDSGEVVVKSKPEKPVEPKKPKLMTFKGLVGLLRDYHDQYASMNTVEGYAKSLLRDFTHEEILGAMEVRNRELQKDYGEFRSFVKNNPGVLNEWQRMCAIARAEGIAK